VDRRYVFGVEEKEMFRELMRSYERFSGCTVTAYCLMDDHFHILLEVPPKSPEGLSDIELLDRLSAIYDADFVAEVNEELKEARRQKTEGAALAGSIHGRFTARMHNLSQFMKALLQRYTQWHNRKHKRKGTLWEERFKSVIVEGGMAARTIAAYIDLNPVRAGVVQHPAKYLWSSYGEAILRKTSDLGNAARAGLARAWGSHLGMKANHSNWNRKVSSAYGKLLRVGNDKEMEAGSRETHVAGTGLSKERVESVEAVDGELPFARMLKSRIRHFTDGAIIGTKAFVDQAFSHSRSRFGPKRKNGARKLCGNGAPAVGYLWSLRDLRVGCG
jgi:REP element-mobilizing transposase RayT